MLRNIIIIFFLIWKNLQSFHKSAFILYVYYFIYLLSFILFHNYKISQNKIFQLISLSYLYGNINISISYLLKVHLITLVY
jgi:hypothetical protein